MIKHIFAAMISFAAGTFQLIKWLICTLEKIARNIINDNELSIDCCNFFLTVNINSINTIFNFG